MEELPVEEQAKAKWWTWGSIPRIWGWATAPGYQPAVRVARILIGGYAALYWALVLAMFWVVALMFWGPWLVIGFVSGRRIAQGVERRHQETLDAIHKGGGEATL